MKTKKAPKKNFPKIYADQERAEKVGFIKQGDWMKEIKDFKNYPCQITVYQFPKKTEAIRFYDGITQHPCHDDQITGVCTIDNLVLVASYESEEEGITLLEVIGLEKK